MNIVLLGAPASGKGTQSSNIINEFGYLHLSTGDIIRNNINNQTEYGIKSRKFVKKGQLVPYSLIIDMVSAFLRENKSDKIIWDGFPRTIEQAKSLDEILKDNNKKIDLVFYLKVNESIALQRAVNRVVCPKCKRSFNLKFAKPKKENYCDYDNEFLVKRSDDDLSKFKTRIIEYDKETKPLLEYYGKKIIEIDSNKDSEYVWDQIKGVINDYN